MNAFSAGPSSGARARSWYTVSMPESRACWRRAQLDRLAVESDRAAVGPHRSGEHLDERALAGAVVADERGHISIEKGMATGVMQKSTVGLGLSLVSDASNGGLLKNNYASLHMAYNLALDAEGNEQLGIGLTGTYANRLLNLNMFDYQSQFGSMGFQRSAPSNDIPVVDRINYIDFNAGVIYSKRRENFGYNFGAALFHASQPAQGAFKNSTYSLDSRYSLQAGMQFYSKNGDEFHVSGLLDIQGKNKVGTLGAVYKIKTRDDII